MSNSVRYSRNPEVNETELDGEIFLIEPKTQEVFYLDEMGAGLWRLLTAPQSMEDAISVYQTAFPEIDQVRVQNDLRIALQALLDRGLIVPVS